MFYPPPPPFFDAGKTPTVGFEYFIVGPSTPLSMHQIIPLDFIITTTQGRWAVPISSLVCIRFKWGNSTLWEAYLLLSFWGLSNWLPLKCSIYYIIIELMWSYNKIYSGTPPHYDHLKWVQHMKWATSVLLYLNSYSLLPLSFCDQQMNLYSWRD